ncbi:GH116 family glycosyl hydrolase [Cohnella cellulosilytica]|uniref:GH116 family glycosyl hydrolase n=1 Tax=Cohnella cellulosilytica TaxID=986710 RepID=A0ABW2F5K2_9BACL
MSSKRYNAIYEDERNARIAFPLGGIGAGMIALEGRGALSHVSLRHAPHLAHEPLMFSAITLRSESGNTSRVLEGQVPEWKIFAPGNGSGFGFPGKTYGLPRYRTSSFEARFPFGIVRLQDESLPVETTIRGWSPFTPLDADNSSLPAAALEYTFRNTSDQPVEIIYSFHAANFMQSEPDKGNVLSIDNGFVLNQPILDNKPWTQGAFCAVTDHPQTAVNYAWFRGGWFDSLTTVWNAVEAGECEGAPPIAEGQPSPGASLYVPLTLAAHASQTVRLRLSWYVPESNLTVGVPAPANGAEATEKSYFKPWYAGRFRDIEDVARYFADAYDTLRADSSRFSDSFYDTTLPEEVVEAAAANLTILKSPTVLRQIDGRLWGWEGSGDREGSCHGSCTHVWNYAQALPHLFPELERSLRWTEFNDSQDEQGHQHFRSSLPIGPTDHDFHAAADGQLGGIMKTYREWRISGDTPWLATLWPKIKDSLDYCIREWDPDHRGVLLEPHHNTYDIEFWGANGMCSSFYLGALKAAGLMAQALGEPNELYDELLRDGRRYSEDILFNGEYFEQHIVWEGLRTPSPTSGQLAWNIDYSPEAIRLLQAEGPKYQYGKGCLSDGMIGAWLAEMCGLGEIVARDKVISHLLSVHKYNLKRDLSHHANPQRPGYAVGHEGGLLLCTWPRGEKLSLPFVYSDEVWTGIEYQVASHLMSTGNVEEGLEIVRTCRDRYDGRTRNPFNEYECGNWYARAMASYGLIQGLSGIRYDAVERTLFVSPRRAGDFRSFLCTASGYGTAGIKDGKPYFTVVAGDVPIDRIQVE